jgi:hypothetical protein
MHSTLHASLPPLKAPAAAAPITGLARRRTKTEPSQATGNKPINHLEVHGGSVVKEGGTIDFA